VLISNLANLHIKYFKILVINDFFKGLKVVELASVLAGPLAGSFFAELGAKVVKIENKNAGGDVTRSWKLPEEAGKSMPSAYYHSANYGKTSLMLNLNDNRDYQLLLNEIETADIIISNYQKSTAEKLSIGIDTLTSKHPGLIFIQLNAFDYEDPRPGYDLVMQAEAGYISMCGEGETLAKMPVAMIDILASHQIKEAALIALLHKEKTGKGSVVHVSLYKSALSGLINQATNFLMEEHIAQPIGTKHPNIAPYGEVFSTSDGQVIMLSIGSDGQFSKFTDLLGIATPSRFKTNIERLKNRVELNLFIKQHCVKYSAGSLIEKFEQEGIPFALVKNMKEVFDDVISQNSIMENNIENSHGKYISSVAFENKDFTS
jgi:crotonobetainyl-CoA:carnitine CoA-transferase CaiB-like acyl-CoA transferase